MTTAQTTATEVYHRLLHAFEKNQIACCILRNYEFLTEGAEYDNADVDLLIARKDFHRVSEILNDLHFQATTQSTVSRHIGYIAFYAPHHLLALDLHLDHPSWNDIPYTDGHAVLQERIIKNDIPIPADHHTLPMLVFHSILDKKNFKEKYINIINEIFEKEKNKDHLFQLFQTTAGTKISERIFSLLANHNYSALLQTRKSIILYLLRSRITHGFNLAACLIRSRSKQIKRKFGRPALLIALLGPDGAGKSTTLTNVQNALTESGLNTTRFYMGRWQDHILPLDRIAKTKGATKQTPQPKTPQQASVSQHADPVKIQGRRIFRFIRDGAYLLEMYMRYFLRLRPALKKGGIVITDRYAYDLLLDPNGTWLLKWAIPYFYPRPHICFYLYHDAQTLIARKGEQSQDEIQRQLTVYNQYQHQLAFTAVKSETPEATAEHVLHLTVEAFFKRF